MAKNSQNKRKRRQVRVRAKIKGTKTRPRLSVFRSNKFIYGQLIDDEGGMTLGEANDLDLGKIGRIEKARKVGKILAERALKKGITKVIFDRGGYKYHGRVKALADASREGGLSF